MVAQTRGGRTYMLSFTCNWDEAADEDDEAEKASGRELEGNHAQTWQRAGVKTPANTHNTPHIATCAPVRIVLTMASRI